MPEALFCVRGFIRVSGGELVQKYIGEGLLGALGG